MLAVSEHFKVAKQHGHAFFHAKLFNAKLEVELSSAELEVSIKTATEASLMETSIVWSSLNP